MTAETAPCGHVGERVIGGYVRCAEGCEGPVTALVRGEPGHVHACACGPCRIRRRGHYVVMRDREAHNVARVYWNGGNNSLMFHVSRAVVLRHWRLEDAEGEVVSSGNCDFSATAGYYHVVFPSVTSDADGRAAFGLEYFRRGRLKDHVQITIEAPPIRIASEFAKIGRIRATAPSNGSATISGVHAACMMARGVEAVSVVTTCPGSVKVTVERGDGVSLGEVLYAAKRACAIGIKIVVEDMSRGPFFATTIYDEA